MLNEDRGQWRVEYKGPATAERPTDWELMLAGSQREAEGEYRSRRPNIITGAMRLVKPNGRVDRMVAATNNQHSTRPFRSYVGNNDAD